MLVRPAEASVRLERLTQRLAAHYGVRLSKGHGFHSALVLRPRSLDDVQLGRGRVLLCGEAAALISPSSAEGISYALWSGSACARAIRVAPDDALPSYQLLCVELLERLEQKIRKAGALRTAKSRRLLAAELADQSRSDMQEAPRNVSSSSR